MYKLYSQRQNASQACSPLEYDTIPKEFIQQYLYIARDIFNASPKPAYGQHRYWECLAKKYCREKGIELLGEDTGEYALEIELFLKHPDTTTEDILDIVELTFSTEIIPKFPQSLLAATQLTSAMTAGLEIMEFDFRKNQYIDELNQRFKQHNLGYALVDGQIIRKDSELLNEKTIVPAFALLKDNRFKSAEEEIQKAFRFRRTGDNAEAILNAAKAFESVMKVICSEMGYEYDADKDTAKNLIAHLEKNAFYPPSLNNHITNIRTTLESALPTVRNKKSGHGAGTASTYISDAFADYALHLAATNIVFLADLFNEKKTQA